MRARRLAVGVRPQVARVGLRTTGLRVGGARLRTVVAVPSSLSLSPAPTGVVRRIHTAGKLDPSDTFIRRHLGPSWPVDVNNMLKVIGQPTVDALIDLTVPKQIRSK